MRSIRFVASLAICLLMLASCSGSKRAAEPSTDFAAYVKAYTGGQVSSGSSIRIEFAADVVNMEDRNVFSFSPSLKGSTHWLSPSSVEFVPDEGELTPGTRYKAVFKLGDVMAVKDASLKSFEFSFSVAPKTALLVLDGIRNVADDSGVVSVSGSVQFSENMDAKEVESMLSVSGAVSSAKLEMLSEGSGQLFSFVVNDVHMGTKEEKLSVRLDASRKGYKTKLSEQTLIPAKGVFKLMSAELHEEADPYIDIRFSEPLDASVAEKGFITLSNVGRFYTQLDANQAKVYFDAMPSGSVVLKLSSNIRNAEGKRLGSDEELSFSPSAVKPAVSLAFSGSILPDDAQLVLPFKAVGLKAVDVSVIRIYENNVLMFLQDNDLSYGSDGIRRSGRMVYKSRVRLDGDPSKDLTRTQLYSVDLSSLFKKEPGAIYRIRLAFNKECSIYAGLGTDEDASMVSLGSGMLSQEEQDVWDMPYPYYYDDFFDWSEYRWEETDDPTKPSYYMESSRFPQCTLLTSDLGIIAKSADDGRLWVSVNDIMTTSPVSGAEVSAYSYQLQTVGSGKTDSDGFLELKTSGKPFALVVKSGKSTGYLKVTDGNENSLSRFDVGGERVSSGLKGFAYGERGVWRPGDTLHVSLVLEDKGKLLPESHPVTMELYTPEGQYYSKQINSSGKKGLYVFNIPTSPSDPTGTWNAYFKVGGASFHKPLHIETVKANRLKVNLTPASDVLRAGTSSTFRVDASWLTGPAASGLKTSVEMSLRKWNSSFKGYEGFSFNDPVSDFTSSSSTLFEKNLGNDGTLTASVQLPKAEGAPGMLSANLITRVMEPGGDASIVTRTIPFAPYKSFVGVKISSGETLETDTDNKFAVIVLDPEGKPVAGDKIEYRIYKLDWSWWWESGRESLDSYVNGSSAVPVSEGSFTSAATAKDISFRVDYPEWGRYLVYVKDVTSGHASGGIIYVDWPSWRGMSQKSDPSGLTMLSFTTDKKAYTVGEEVTVYIPAADGGRALVSLENGRGVISRTWVKTSAKSQTQYKFKLSQEMAPNFYIHISLLQPHEHTANDLPIRMYGVQPVLVTDKASHLEPVLTAPEVIRPQQEFTVSVKEKSGRPMAYTLAIVDEGLLDITSFRTPDPWAAMNAREALGVKTWDMYNDVIGAFSGRFSPLMSIGGDIDLQMADKKDKRFNPVVKFYGPFTLSKGEQKHKITLPMYVGSVRVMVVAAQDGAYGNAEKAVPVRNPLMILPTLPRTLGTGEKVVLPVNVFAMEDDIKNVKVCVSVEGPAKLSSEASKSISFSGTGDQLVDFALSTSSEEGVAKVTVTAESGSRKVQETISVEVRNPGKPVMETYAAMVKAGKSQKFDFAAFKRGSDSWARLQYSNFPAIDFDGLFTFVGDYAYDCTEQLASRGMSLVYMKQFLSPDNAKRADDMVASVLQALYGRQLPDGSFAYWPGQAYANEWATSMAGQFMVDAAAMGYSVNKAAINSWKRFQKKAATNYKHVQDYGYYDLQQAYRLYTLALAGASEDGAMNRLKAAPEMTNQARWRLAAAYALTGKKNVAKQLIEKLDTSLPDTKPGMFTFGNAKDTAMLLETAVLTDEMVVAMELAEEVAQMLRVNGITTQTAAFSALAMNRLAKKVGDGAMELSLSPSDGKAVKTAKSTAWVDVDPSEGRLEVTNKSQGPVYASLQICRPVSAETKVEARSSNISVSVRYTDMSGKEISPASIKQGQDFKADIIVAASGINAAAHTGLALTFQAASGWEIFNERLFDQAGGGQESYDYKDVRDDRVVWYFDLPAASRRLFSVRLQAAYAGEFVLPAVSCEAMYDSNTYANTASGRTSVEK